MQDTARPSIGASGYRPTKATYRITIAVRLDDTDAAKVKALSETFAGSVTEAVRWLLRQPEVITTMTERVEGRR